jgi:tetratricopeptide (TPR) repeat protein
LAYSEEFQSCQHDYSEFLSRIGRCLQSDGRYSEAQILLDDTLEIEEKALGPEHPNVLASVSSLGVILAQQGKYEGAEVMLRRALEGREKVLGPEHPNTLRSASTPWFSA